jgi:hypothetical protein
VKKARIHIRMGTAIMPKRQLNDVDTTDDIIELDLNDNERVVEIELVKQAGPYIQRYETPEEAERSFNLVNSPEVKQIVSELDGVHTPRASPMPRLRSYKLRDEVAYRYRAVTIEEDIHIDEQETREMTALPSGEIEDAEVVREHEIVRRADEQ